MSIQIRSGLAAVALASLLAACGSPDAPEPAGEETAAAMPETPDRSETAADEAGMAPEQAVQGTAPDAGPQGAAPPPPEKKAPAPAY